MVPAHGGQPGRQFHPALGGVDPQAGDIDLDFLLGLSPVEEGQVGFEVQAGVVAGTVAFGNKQLALVYQDIGEIYPLKYIREDFFHETLGFVGFGRLFFRLDEVVEIPLAGWVPKQVNPGIFQGQGPQVQAEVGDGGQGEAHLKAVDAEKDLAIRTGNRQILKNDS